MLRSLVYLTVIVNYGLHCVITAFGSDIKVLHVSYYLAETVVYEEQHSTC